MSLLFCDSFDNYGCLRLKYDNVVLNRIAPVISGAYTRNSPGALLYNSNNVTNNNQFAYVTKNFPNSVTLIAGFAVYCSLSGRTPVPDWGLIQFMDSSTVQVDLRMTQSGLAYFTRNGTVLGSATAIGFSFNTWHYIEVSVTINSTTGSVTLKCDGTQFINLTSQNTRASANNQTNAINIGQTLTPGSSTIPVAIVAIDDFYVCDTNGSVNNTFLGDVAVRGLLPTGNGTSSQYTRTEASWASSTMMWIGRRIKDSNGNIQQVTACTSDCKTAGSTPSWNVTTGGTTTDNHVTWTNIGSATDYLDIGWNPVGGLRDWLEATSVPVGFAVVDKNGNIQVVTTAGITGIDAGTLGVIPAWSAVIGGTTTDGTATWTMAMALTSFDDMYLVDSTVGHIERFTFPSVSAASVNAVAVTMRVRKDDASVRSVRAATLSGGTVGDSGSDIALAGSYAMVQGMFETDPHTSAAWAPSAANAAEFGIKTTA